MKNLINIKTNLVLSVCVAGTLLLASSCSENKTLDSREIAEKANIAKQSDDNRNKVVVDNDDDAKFLMDAAEMQLEEISLGKLAQQKGNSPHVKELGLMMVTDHTKSHTELKALAKSKYITLPSSITQDTRDSYRKLEDKSANDFGKAYSGKIVENHEDAIKLFEKASNDSEDPEIRAWASKQLPGLRTHLKHAEACKKECEKQKS